MPTIRKTPFTLFILFLTACNVSKQNPLVETKVDRSNFYISDGCYTRTKKPYELAYVFEGEVQNQSDKRFKKGIYFIDIQLELENGNIIDQTDEITQYKTGQFMKILSDIEPNETIQINRFHSIRIPVEYCTYPVKKVKRFMRCYLSDEINSSETLYESSVDITDKWNQVIKRVKENEVDCTCFWDFVK